MKTSDRDQHGRSLSRRRVMSAAGVSAATLAFGSITPRRAVAENQGRFPDDPFALGVASGDPLSDSVVIWTRLAPNPLAPFGGMDRRKAFPVRWQVATDENFRNIVRHGTVFAEPEYVHTMHVDVTGLKPDHEYYYRFKSGPQVSPVGRTKTAPTEGARLNRLAFAFVSCQNWGHGYYTAYKHLAHEDLDFVVHLGDYIYEYGIGSSGKERGITLPQRYGREAITLDDYRGRYALYKTDPHLQAAHALFPWFATTDDHEVVNDYADEDGAGMSPADFLVRRANAYRAYWEHMPLRPPRKPTGSDLPLYRRLTFGNLVEFSVLDTRQYRDDQNSSRRLDPARSITGDAQEQWLLKGLARSHATWNVIAQQVFFSQLDYVPGPEQGFSAGAWDGYVASRDRVLSGITERQVRNPIVLTGDKHQNHAVNIKKNFDDLDSLTIGTEFVGTSITSGRDGSDIWPQGRKFLEANPHVKFVNGQRGYVRCTLTPEHWTTDYRVVPYVTRPDAPISTRATFVVEDGSPGLQPS